MEGKHADHVIGIGLKYEFDKEEMKPENFNNTKEVVLAKVTRAMNDLFEHYQEFHR